MNLSLGECKIFISETIPVKKIKNEKNLNKIKFCGSNINIDKINIKPPDKVALEFFFIKCLWVRGELISWNVLNFLNKKVDIKEINMTIKKDSFRFIKKTYFHAFLF